MIRLVAGIMLTLGFGIAFVAGHGLYSEGLLPAPGESRARAVPGNGQGPLSLTFENVDFGYVENEPVLSDLTFRLEAGKVLGLLGRTGSGKTTLARLILRLYDTDAGSVLLGDRNVKSYGLDELRNTVAMVTQDVQLFQASVRDNLTFFDSSVTDARLEEVIEVLGLADWYSALPEGLDSRLQAGGKGLSAGEAQLLAFTRIFLRDPRLVILDEASSRLDPATEALIERVVDRLLVGRTAIVIAHRLATVNRAEEILIIGDGRAVEKGSRSRLAKDEGSTFFRLLQTGMEEVLS